MEAKLTLIVVWCLMVAGGVLADEENRLAGDAGGQENKNNDAQYPLECSDETRLPEHIVNCELLIAGLKADAGVNRQELCCTLLSSQATKSMCCHQVRSLCESHSTSQCPKSRRRIKPPRPVSERSGKGKKMEQATTEPPPASILFHKVKKVDVDV